MRKTIILLMMTALAVTLMLVLVGCSSEKTAPPTNTTPSSSLPAVQPVSSVPAPAVTTNNPPAVTTTLPSVNPTTSPPVKPTTQPATTQVSGGMDKALKALMDKSLSIDSMKFDMVIFGGMMTSKAYQKKSKSRMETNMMGINMIMITDEDKKIMYTYLPDQNKASKIDLDQATSTNSQTDFQNIWDYNMVVKGTETLDGKTCTVAEYSADTPQGRATGKIWLWQEYGVPLRMDTTMSGTDKDSMNMTVTIEFKNYEFVNLPDSLFELPSGVEMVDNLDIMPSGLPSGLPTNLPSK